MNRNRRARLTRLVLACDPAVILKVAARCDGHTILDPKAFVSDGLPEEVVAHLTRTYKSDGSPKGSIFVRGQRVKELAGVYGLDLLRFLASALSIDYPEALGRGTEARNIQIALRQHLAGALPAKPAKPAS